MHGWHVIRRAPYRPEYDLSALSLQAVLEPECCISYNNKSRQALARMDGFFKKAAAQVSKDVYAHPNGAPEMESTLTSPNKVECRQMHR